MAPILEVADLGISFGELHVLTDVSLEVDEVGVHCVLGPNGAGKTTLFNCVTGFLRPDAGSVTFRGEHAGRASGEHGTRDLVPDHRAARRQGDRGRQPG